MKHATFHLAYNACCCSCCCGVDNSSAAVLHHCVHYIAGSVSGCGCGWSSTTKDLWSGGVCERSRLMLDDLRKNLHRKRGRIEV